MSNKHEENWYTHWPQQQCGSFKRPKMMTQYPQPPCLQFRRLGSCSYGDNCRYAHITGSSILGPWKAHHEFKEEDQNKTKPCYFFSSHRGCFYGNKCIFLHENDKKFEGGNIGLCRDSCAISIETSRQQVSANKRTRYDTMDLGKKLVKTKFCIQWKKDGSCSYGSHCQFAHGKAELQSLGSSNPLELLNSSGISAPAKNAASNKTGFSSLSERRFLFKWTNIQKISKIYADWIETVQLLPYSSNTVENSRT